MSDYKPEIETAINSIMGCLRTGSAYYREDNDKDGDYESNYAKSKLTALIQSETTKAILATWNYTGEGYNGEYVYLTHNGGKHYTDEEVEAKVIKEILAQLQAEGETR